MTLALTTGSPLALYGQSICYIAGEGPDGLVSIDNAPGRAVVDLFQRSTNAWVARAVSNSSGEYLFDGLNPGQEYDLIGRDLIGVWADVIVGRVQPYARPQITTSSLAFSLGNPATTQMASQYGGGPLVWSIDVLPPGLAMSSTGLWSGTPTEAGSIEVHISCTDVYGETDTKTFTVVVT